MRLLNKAIDLTVAQYSPLTFKEMSYEQVIASQQFLKNRKHDMGLAGGNYNDKFELASTPSFKAYQKKFENSTKPSTFKLFWKTENLKESKAKFVPRLIFGSSLESEITERRQFQHFSKEMARLRWSIPSKIGISNVEFGKLYKHHRFHQNYSAIAVDYSAQDTKMPQPIIDARNRVMARLAQQQGLPPHAINRIVAAGKHVENFFALTPTGEVFLLKSGVPSGLYLGAEGNTLNHSIIGNYLDLKMTLANAGITSKHVDSRYGDDWLRSLAPNRQNRHFLNSRDKFFSFVKNDLGMATTVDLWGDKPLDHHEPAFLRRSFTEFKIDHKKIVVPKFDSVRTLQKWVTPHSLVLSPQDSFDRSLGFLLLSGADKKNYGIIRQYMDSLVANYDIKVPDLYTNMSLHSLTKDYYTNFGRPSLSLAKHDAKHFAPDFIPTTRLSLDEKGKLTKLEQMSHADLLLSGDIEENPGPKPITRATLAHWAAYVRRSLANNLVPLPQEFFFSLKNKNFSDINKLRKHIAKDALKIYRKTIPHLPAMAKRFISEAKQKLSDRFTKATLPLVTTAKMPSRPRPDYTGIRALSLPDTSSRPFATPCGATFKAHNRDRDHILGLTRSMPGSFPDDESHRCTADIFEHSSCPIQPPHCALHCTMISSTPIPAKDDNPEPEQKVQSVEIPLPEWVKTEPGVTVVRYENFVHVQSRSQHILFYANGLKPLVAQKISIFRNPDNSLRIIV
ncbi:RdRp [Plasmopara viticola lesion associated yadokari virus 1]|uniref:RdRp n=1 Tax=Plasmopara viticola lesion associated yadokari virus 1 TaxID=2692093 RepID=A0ABX6H5Y5_9VIRU|nr:RdRp [Plasmopara viticola lesion associated yadokari virus 1]QHD64758.1 RdRp [Plasmopara viticola lesion associated yadokari virus 1]